MIGVASAVLHIVTLALLAKIAVTDLKIQKIYNRDVLLLAALGLAMLTLGVVTRAQRTGTYTWEPIYIAAGIAVVLFFVMFPFWMARKLGAGDVKLMAVIPLVVGLDGMPALAVLLLAFLAATVFFVKNPLLLPATAFRFYVEHLERKGVVPFGVPISLALAALVASRAVGYAP